MALRARAGAGLGPFAFTDLLAVVSVMRFRLVLARYALVSWLVVWLPPRLLRVLHVESRSFVCGGLPAFFCETATTLVVPLSSLINPPFAILATGFSARPVLFASRTDGDGGWSGVRVKQQTSSLLSLLTEKASVATWPARLGLVCRVYFRPNCGGNALAYALDKNKECLENNERLFATGTHHYVLLSPLCLLGFRTGEASGVFHDAFLELVP